jgi:hypothetical protein
MKKTLLLTLAILSILSGISQVNVYVDAPSPNSGNYVNTYANENGTDWGSPDMLNPDNIVLGEFVLAYDNTENDSLTCETVINGSEVNGKIAVIYRGICNFSTKALMCQNAGAIAVIIVNHTGDAVGMAGGTDGASVTIPVVMISEQAGALLHDEIAAGGLTGFIGNKAGYYGDDLGIGQYDIYRAKQFTSVQSLSQDDSEFFVETGGWVFNYGSNDQTNVTLNCIITFNNDTIYNEISTPAPIDSEDSLFISFPNFSQTTYTNGYYTMTYAIDSDGTEEFEDDNKLNADFAMSEDLFTYSRVDPTSLMPNPNSGFYAGENNTFSACVVFSDPNASRMGAYGLTFSAGTRVDEGISLDGKVVNIEAFSWDDGITDINDPNFALSADGAATFTSVDLITEGEFEFEDVGQYQNVFAKFEEPFVLEDDQPYLFCVTSYDYEISIGSDTKVDYLANIDNEYSPTTNNGMPTTAVKTDNGWFAIGFGTDVSSAIGVNLFPAVELGVEESKNDIELSAYPNPANEILNIPMPSKEGSIIISIFDTAGKLVDTKTVNNTSNNSLSLNVSNLENGLYMFNVKFEDGTNTTMNIVINK